MLPTERRLAIVAQMHEQPMVRADALASRFDVSVETVRRDLRRLNADGLLHRVYGGATRPTVRSAEGSFDRRRTMYAERKRAIARLAAGLVGPADPIMLDVGTTALEVARALPLAFHGLVFTNSVLVAAELAGRERVRVHLSGGEVRAGDLACSGQAAADFFDDVYVDKAFLGSGGVHPDAGLTDYYSSEVAVRRIVLEHAASAYILADSSKLGVIAVQRVCALERVTAVLTDDVQNSDAVAALTAAGAQVRTAHVEVSRIESEEKRRA